MLIKEAVDVLVKKLKEDPGYRIGWEANIAMAFYDEFTRRNLSPCDIDQLTNQELRDEIHSIANRAADNFLNLLCRDREHNAD